jgi:hypothetical protein
MQKVPPQDIVDQLEMQLAQMPPGATRIKVDGLETEFSIDEALKALSYWKSQAAKDKGTRPRISSIDLTGG